MLVIFLQDYRGKLTGERFYVLGETVDLPEGAAMELAHRHIVDIVKPVEEPPASQPAKPRRRRKAKGEE